MPPLSAVGISGLQAGEDVNQEQVAKVIGLAASMRQANLDHAKEKQRERQQDRGPDRGR